MKLFTSILATIVLFLSTQCLIIDTQFKSTPAPEKKSCCSKKKTCEKQVATQKEKDCKKEKDKDCKDACNPFMACCGCLYDGIPKNDLTIDKPYCLSVMNGNKEPFFKSAYIPGIWQPPETVI